MPDKPFVLGVKAIIIDEQRRCLLLRRSKHNRSLVGCWEWPGGKVEPTEDFTEAVVREAREETALEIEITGLAGATQCTLPHLNVVLLCMETSVTGGQLALSPEHDDAAWVSFEDLPKWNLPEEIREFMMEYIARKGSQL